MKLYLVRHGQSINNANVDHPGHREPDPPLTELGLEQAAVLAAYLRANAEPDQLSDTLAWRYGPSDALRFKVDRVITSPMYRALQTTAPLASSFGAPVKVWWDVCERGGMFHYTRGKPHGLPGLKRSAIRSEFPDYDLPTRISENGWWRGNQESREASRLRAADVASRLVGRAADEWRGEHVWLISHAGLLDALVKALNNNLTPQTDDGVVHFFYNTSVSRIDFFEGGLGVRYINRVAHLPDALIS